MMCARFCVNPDMTLVMVKEGWRERLEMAIVKSGRSDRSISLGAGLSQNYVQQMRSKGKMPGADALIKICGELGLSTTYVFTGSTMTQREEEMLSLFSSLDEEQKTQFLNFLRSLQPTDAAHE
jgi:transcriptional regulator with XRE-family HTH domain